MTSHLGLDDLAFLVARDPRPQSTQDHLADCDVCRDRLANLRARSAEVSSALSGIDGLGAASADVEPMPDEVTLRITAALAAELRAVGDERVSLRTGMAAGDAAAAPQPDGPSPDSDDATRPDELAHARSRMAELARARARSRRLVRGWLTAAAVVVVVGGGSGVIAHFAAGRSADTSTAESGAAGAASRSGSLNGGASTSAGATATPTANAAANPGAARGVLSKRSFVEDAEAFVGAQNLVKPSKQASEPLTGSASGRCATLARGEASSTAGYKAGGGNAAPAAFIGAVTVDGHQGVLYLVDVGPVRVAVAIAGCATSNPDVLASATL